MRVWLLQGRQGEDPGGIRASFRQLADRPGCAGWRLDACPLTPDLPARVQAQRPDALVLAAALCPFQSGAEEFFPADVGLVVAVEEGAADALRDLAERYPLLFVPPQPTAESLALALRGALAAVHRQQHWKTQVEQLHQRLNDRIVIERAKGVLVQRLGINEEEAYRRLRVLSRRQRRQIRDIAQSLLDTQSLLLPGGTNGFLPPESAGGPGPAPERSEPPAPEGA